MNKSVICPTLVGRAGDLAAILRSMQLAAQGSGQLTLVSGEAGLGKSRLVAEVIRTAQQEGMLVLKGNCFETDRGLPYAPVTDLLRSFRLDHMGENIEAHFGSTASELVKILPELAAAIDGVTATSILEPRQEKHRIFQALAQFLLELSSQALFIVFEDLHWSDETSLEFLLDFSRHVPSRHVFFLLTYRSDELNPELGRFLAELDRRRLATEVVLTPLSPDDVHAMLQAIFDLDRPVRSEFMNILYPLSGGNPFFIEEILKSMLIAGEIFFADGVWDRKPVEQLHIPRSVQDAVRRRTDQLTAEAAALLIIAAVMGQRFEFTLLREVTQWKESDLLPRIKELMAAQLIVEETGERFAFRHALTREAVYSRLMEREREDLHQKIGEALELRGGASTEERVANLAYHFYQAKVWQKAFEYSQQAGENAQRQYASQAVVEHFSHSIQAAEKIQLPSSPHLHRARGAAYERLGDFEAARFDYETALQAAHAAQDRVVEWQSMLDLGALWAGRDYLRTGEHYQRALDLVVEINDPQMLAHNLNRLGNWEVNTDRLVEGLRHHEQALTLFASHKNKKGLGETFDLLGMANYIHGDLVQSEAYYQQALQVFRELDDRERLASSLASMTLNSAHLQSGMGVLAKTDRALALQGCQQALRLSREIGWRSGEAYAMIILGDYWGIRGNYASSLGLLKMSLSIAQEIGHEQWKVYSRYCLGALYLNLLDLSKAREHLEYALEHASSIGSRWWITNITGFLAQVSVLQGDYERAAAVLEAALEISIEGFPFEGGQVQPSTLGQRLCWLAYSQLMLSRGKPEWSLRVVNDLLASAANLTPGEIIAPLWLVLGQVLMALNQPAQAEETLLAARDAAERENEKPLQWRVEASLGKLYQLQQHRKQADGAFQAAQELIKEIARSIPENDERLTFLERALAQLPKGRSLTPRQVAKREFGGLTSREREVAAIIAKGKSNREIAESLVVSERTIETHVENILHRLGFSSRAQIAAWAVEKGLLQDPGTDPRLTQG